ncbi:MAG: aldo/keto reductase [Bifidobacterium sp.]|nr:aldo/keto reductase [Bifidobacterium sp.]
MTTQATDIPMLKLNDGHTLPAVGFGTYKLNGIAGSQAIEGALGNGYRLLDTAFNYENEGAVGAAVRRSDVPREQIIISSKLPGRHHAYAEALATIEESVYRTGLDHLDLYLIHWPNPKQGKYVEAWKALIEARRRGLVTSIGVSNFLPEHLQRLIDETGVTPAVNQIEMHPYFPQAEQHAWDAAHGIVDEAWSPLGRANSLLRDPAIQRIADAHRRSLVQVVLRWHVQLGVIPLPKATHAERQMQNLSLFDFELSPEEMAEITALGRPDGRTANQDPAEYEEF